MRCGWRSYRVAPSDPTRLPGRGRVPLVAAGVVCILVGLPVARAELARFRQRTSAGPEQVRLRDREALARAMPQDARVLATWRATPLYMFWAPQGRYVNVLDPVFLAAVEPGGNALLEEIFAGEEPDVPWVATSAFDSEYLALSTVTAEPTLLARLEGDPRVVTLHRGINALYRFQTPPGGVFFVRDWRIAPEAPVAFTATPEELEQWPWFQWAGSETTRAADALEAYVDARRVGEGCAHLVHPISGPSSGLYELAASGPTELWLDGELLVADKMGSGAVLGRGLIVPLDLSAGEHRLVITTCPARGCFFVYQATSP